MRTKYLTPVLGAISVVLLLGSFFVEGVPQDIMRLLGSVLLLVYCISKIMCRGKNGKPD